MSDQTSKQHWARADELPLVERLSDYWSFASDLDGEKIEVFPKKWGYEALEALEAKDREIEKLRAELRGIQHEKNHSSSSSR